MAIDFFLVIFVLSYELFLYVVRSLVKLIFALILRKTFTKHITILKRVKKSLFKSLYSYRMLDRPTFSSKLSFLFRNKMNAVLTKYLLLQMESNSLKLSCIRFTDSSSTSTRSYSDSATKKMIEVTSSKQWIHFLRSDRWPPTSNTRKLRSFTLKLISTMPVVLTLERRMSCVEGKKLGLVIASSWSRKYLAESFN